MKLTRRFGAAVAALALGAGVSAVSTPAHAATPTTVKLTVQDIDGTKKVEYGDYIEVTAEPTDATGAEIDAEGTVTLYASPHGKNQWTAVSSSSYDVYYDLEGIKKRTDFKATFSGGTGYDANDNQVSYAPSTSAVVATGKVGRGQLVTKDTKKKICVKVGPKPYKNKPIYYYSKVGKQKSFHLDFVEHTNSKSMICTKLKKYKKTKSKPVKGPKHGKDKTVYVKTGGMKKTTYITKW